MKSFIDSEERLIIKIPEDWFFVTDQYNGDVSMQPFGFEPYHDRNAAFQISYADIQSKKKIEIDPQPKGKNNLSYIENEFEGIKTWVTNIEGGGVVVITFTYDKSICDKQKKIGLKNASESVKSLLIFDDTSKERILPNVRWNRFMISYAASMDLTNRAYTNCSNIELVVLLANQLDAVLRQSIILKKQIVDLTDEIDISLIYQKETDKPIMEKKIYEMALTNAVINQEMYDDLVRLYDVRNKVIHRFVISDLRSNDIIQLVWSYSLIYDKLGDDLNSLEQTQFKNQIGIYKTGARPDRLMSEKMMKSLIAKIRDKHGNRKLIDGMTIKI
jgi:hypothetical protein